MRKLMDKIKKNNKGFTLVELIVVIAVLAIITVVAAPQYIKYVEKSRIGVDENALGEIAHVAEIAFVEKQASTTPIASTTTNGVTSTTGTVVVTIEKGVPKYSGTIDNASQYVGDYTFKSDEYKNATVTITIVDGVSTKTDGKPFAKNR